MGTAVGKGGPALACRPDSGDRLRSSHDRRRESRIHPDAQKPRQDGTEFRHVVIQPSTGYFTNDLLLLDYRSSLVPGDWFNLESARLTIIPPRPRHQIVPAGDRAAEGGRTVAGGRLVPATRRLPRSVARLRRDRDRVLATGSKSKNRQDRVRIRKRRPAPLDWVPRKFTKTWLPGTRLRVASMSV